MQTPQRLVDERYALARRPKKQLIVVPVQLTVEARELCGREVLAVVWFVVFVLRTHISDSTPKTLSCHSPSYLSTLATSSSTDPTLSYPT